MKNVNIWPVYHEVLLTNEAKPAAPSQCHIHTCYGRLTFIEIQIVPPLHCRDVSKPVASQGLIRTRYRGKHRPHVCDLMTLDDCDPFSTGEVGFLRVEEEGGRTSCDKTLGETVND